MSWEGPDPRRDEDELERIWPDPERRDNALDWILVRIWTGRTPLHPRRTGFGASPSRRSGYTNVQLCRGKQPARIPA